MYYNRELDLSNLLGKKSYFLFGPRSTGKTFLINQTFKNNATVIKLDLLESELYLRLFTNPGMLESIILAQEQCSLVIIDEVQRVPEILNEVHRLIEKFDIHFLLTGSSARKLKYNQANLLAGRARQAELFPLCSSEISDFNLDRYLHFGGIPMIYNSDEPIEDLHAYVDTYLKEEIKAEALVRQLPAFTRFLKYAALTSGEILNFSNISSDAAIPASTVREYYTILEDTFIGFMLPAWTKSVKRKPISKAKFYYFDIGVKNILSGITSVPEQSDLYGAAFEHFIALELRAYLSYRRKHLSLSYWQAINGQEVDFIIGDSVAIEVKASSRISAKHLKGLKALVDENICTKYILISKDTISRKIDCFELMPWNSFLSKLWNNEIV